jgi:two-component system, NarL family, response regulator NreC
MSIRILITDDHGVIRAGLRALLAGTPDIEVVGEASDGRQVLQKAMELKPDVILMDLSMPEMGGIEATRQLQTIIPEARILILTLHEDEGLLKEVIKAGASGYIIKRAVEAELITAIHSVADGDIYIHPTMMRALVKGLSPATPPATTQTEELTPREVDVLRLLARGNTNRQIAEKLSISQRTVEGHRVNLSGKLGLRSRVDLVNYAEAHGLLELGKQK